MGYGSNGNSYQGYQGGSGVHHNNRSRRRDYEELSNGTNSNNRMQSMEVLSGREYGLEFDSSDGPQNLKHRATLYCLVGFLILIVLTAPHRDHGGETSNFKLPKNSNNNRTNATVSTATTQAPTSLSSESKATSSEPAQTNNSSNATRHTRPTYADQCHLPASFQMTNNFTFLNDTNFCLNQTANDNDNQSTCTCKDPVTPAKPDYAPVDWPRAMQMNVELMQKAIASTVDVVFVGDSITEHWNGRDMAEFRPKDHNVSVVFEQLFSKATNASNPQGLALGIAGDRCQNLLYRLQNGEMPAKLQPKIWWILIGTNDLGSDHCNANAITAGTIRIVEELQQHSPNATIVINSILPRGGSNHSSQELLHISPTWPIMQTINQRLECFANQTSTFVQFFNATDLFVYTQDDDDANYGREVYINQTLMNDYLHPSGEGALKWGRAMVDKIRQLLGS